SQRGDVLIIQADLVKVPEGTQLWGEQYNRKLSDVLTIQSDISKEISEQLRQKLTGEQVQRATKTYTKDNDAYRLYLQGRYYWNKRTGDGFQKAIEYFKQAVDKDPNYAPAYAGLSDSFQLLGFYGLLPPKEANEQAKTYALKALDIDNNLVEAHTSL